MSFLNLNHLTYLDLVNAVSRIWKNVTQGRPGEASLVRRATAPLMQLIRPIIDYQPRSPPIIPSSLNLAPVDRLHSTNDRVARNK